MKRYHRREVPLVRISPGFWIAEMDFDSSEVSVARIKMEKSKMPRYPAGSGFNCLSTDMYVTVLEGKIFYFEEGYAGKMFEVWDTIFIPRGTNYFWDIASDEVTLLAVNNPAFRPEDRKS